MIALSDLVILAVSASLLGAGVYRWQSNTTPADSFASQTSTQVSAVTEQINQSGNPRLDTTRLDTTRTASVNPQGNLFGKVAQNVGSSVPAAPSAIAIAPEVQETTPAPKVVDVKVNAPLYGTHVIESGDTLSVLALRFGTTVKELQSINGINGSLITVGESLHYPLPAN